MMAASQICFSLVVVIKETKHGKARQVPCHDRRAMTIAGG
jgi:hypothetical protein